MQGENDKRGERRRRPLLAICATTLAALGWIGGPTAAAADTLEDWRRAADRVIAIYEQSNVVEKAYDAVTGDFDCQGLSLGSKQWPFQNGSIRRIFARLGEETTARTIAEAMPTHGAVFQRAADASFARRHSQARRITLELQNVSASGCQGPQGASLRAGVEAELQAWLLTPVVLAAQQAEERRISARAIALSTCWAKRIREAEAPRFTEYMFFYDFLVQNGGAWVEDFILIDAYDRINYRQYRKGDAELVSEKMSVILQFYETDWRVAHARGYLRDAKANAALLRAALERGEIGVSETGLLLVKLFRGMLGNTPFALPSMNRGVISLLGEGHVNGARYDVRGAFSARGALQAGEIPENLTCERS